MLCVVFLALVVWVFLTAPSARRCAPRGQMFAHRGLHTHAPENSLAAFEAAAAAGFGVELDVRLTLDGVPVVRHDGSLIDLGLNAHVQDACCANLPSLADGSPMPTLADALSCIGGRVPVLVELKHGRRDDALCKATLKCMQACPGDYLVESFNPLMLRWFRRHAPEFRRGQLVCSFHDGRKGAGAAFGIMGSLLLFNALSRPDFVAYDVNARLPALWLQRHVFHAPLAGWTVRNKTQARALADQGEMVIFEY